MDATRWLPDPFQASTLASSLSLSLTFCVNPPLNFIPEFSPFIGVFKFVVIPSILTCILTFLVDARLKTFSKFVAPTF